MTAIRTIPGQPEERVKMVKGDTYAECIWSDGTLYVSDVPNLFFDAKPLPQVKKKKKAKHKPKPKKKAKAAPAKAAAPKAAAAPSEEEASSSSTEEEEEDAKKDAEPILEPSAGEAVHAEPPPPLEPLPPLAASAEAEAEACYAKGKQACNTYLYTYQLLVLEGPHTQVGLSRTRHAWICMAPKKYP